MMGNFGFGGWWMLLLGMLIPLLILVGVVVIIVLLLRSTEPRSGNGTASRGFEDPARQALEQRLARGEITSDQFNELLSTLMARRGRDQ